MNKQSTSPYRAAPALSSLALMLALGGCGGNEPAPVTATASMSRSAASTIVVDPKEQYSHTLQELYVAYFGRPAEPAGMFYWNHLLEEAQAPPDATLLAARYRSDARIRAMFDAFANSEESRQLYPGATAQFVEGVYRNLFNRPADQAGMLYWAKAIDTGVITRAEAGLFIMLGAQNEDALGVRNKIVVATTFYRILTERTGSVLSYTGNRNNEIARRMMAMVDAKTDLAAFEATIRATIAEMDLSTRP